jgi:hypothetical protein
MLFKKINNKSNIQLLGNKFFSNPVYKKNPHNIKKTQIRTKFDTTANLQFFVFSLKNITGLQCNEQNYAKLVRQKLKN